MDDLDKLIPHRPPLRWIDALTACTDTTASATVTLRPDHFALADGALLETALVECVAQTVAAAAGHRAVAGGSAERPRGGMLAAVSNFQIHVRPRVGQSLQIDVRELKRFGPMQLVSGVVSCAGQVVATGELTVHA